MKLFSPTVTLTESSIRCRIGFPGVLLLAAFGGSALVVMAIRRRHGGATSSTTGGKTTELRLREVEQLLGHGLITEEERIEARARILSEV